MNRRISYLHSTTESYILQVVGVENNTVKTKSMSLGSEIRRIRGTQRSLASMMQAPRIATRLTLPNLSPGKTSKRSIINRNNFISMTPCAYLRVRKTCNQIQIYNSRRWCSSILAPLKLIHSITNRSCHRSAMLRISRVTRQISIL